MFKKFRYQLLATYLLFTLLLVIAFVLNLNYLKKSERLTSVIEEIKNIHLLFLEDQKALHTFLSYEIKEKEFYLRGQSNYTAKHNEFYWEISNRLDSLSKSNELKNFEKANIINDISAFLDDYNAVLIKLIFKIRAKGTDGAGLEGEIDYNSSNLAGFNFINTNHIFNLRLAEKNFLIKNDSSFLAEMHKEAFYIKNNIKKDLVKKQSADSALYFLENYITAFDSLVSMENTIGLTTNSGLKKKTDILANDITDKFIFLRDNAIVYKSNIEKKLFIYYLIFFILLIVLGISLSISLSRKQTKRISLLSANIEHFINSEFTDTNKFKLKSTNDELGGLIKNFKILQKEIDTLIFGFKAKVAERTAEIFEQKIRIETQNDEIKIRNHELQLMNQLIEEQKQQVEKKNKNMLDSINYAEKIQKAILPDNAYFQSVFRESLIFYKPKDIVSGDFYWLREIKNDFYDITILILADCTGHGVPGAFMSLLGTAFLNEIVLRKNVLQASHILDSLKQTIIQALTGSSNDAKLSDGMEMSVCIFHNKSNKLEFAGAGRPLLIVRDNEMIKIDGDRQNIGKNHVSHLFTNHTIQLFNNDQIYLFSDGYYSQFGGEKRRKFSRKKFYAFLTNNSSLDMVSQFDELEKEFNIWKGNQQQIDDILVIGIKYEESNVLQSVIDFKEREIYAKFNLNEINKLS